MLHRHLHYPFCSQTIVLFEILKLNKTFHYRYSIYHFRSREKISTTIFRFEKYDRKVIQRQENTHGPMEQFNNQNKTPERYDNEQTKTSVFFQWRRLRMVLLLRCGLVVKLVALQPWNTL